MFRSRRHTRLRASRVLDAVLAAVAFASLVLPTDAVACSGTGVQELMANSARQGWIHFGISALLSVVAIVVVLKRHAGWRGTALILLLLALHPGWWLSAYLGDCGWSRLKMSVWTTAMIASVLASPLFRSARDRWNLRYALYGATGTIFAIAVAGLLGGSAGAGLIEASTALLPSIASCLFAITEWILDAPLVQTVRRWKEATDWQRRVLTIAGIPLVPMSLMIILLAVGLSVWFVRFAPDTVRRGVDPWPATTVHRR